MMTILATNIPGVLANITTVGNSRPAKKSGRYNRADEGAAIALAAGMAKYHHMPYYVYATYYGYTVTTMHPPAFQSHIRATEDEITLTFYEYPRSAQ